MSSSQDSSSRLLLYGGAVAAAGLLGLLMLPILLFSKDTQEQPEQDGVCVADAAGKVSSAKAVEIPPAYKSFVEKASKTSGLPVPLLAAQLEQESAWNPKATSPVGAQGLAQFMPGTWASYGKGKSPTDPEAAIDAQGRYMKDLVKQVSPVAKSEEDRVKFALAAYNAGPGAVLKFNGIPPYQETQDYVKKITTKAQVQYSDDCKPALEQAASITLTPGKWAPVVPGAKVTSKFGPRPCPFITCVTQPWLTVHEGIDLAGGSKYFYAPADMTVTYVSKGPSDPLWKYYGEYIYAIQDAPPHLVFEFHEAAQGSLRVKAGDKVKAGTPLGTQGATGNSSGVHVHFQVNRPGTDVSGPTIQNGKSLDPLPFLREKGVAP